MSGGDIFTTMVKGNRKTTTEEADFLSVDEWNSPVCLLPNS